MRKLGLVLALFGVLGLFCATAEAKKPMRPRKGMVKKGQTKWAPSQSCCSPHQSGQSTPEKT